MLTFEFKQDTEFSNPYYEITLDSDYVGSIRYENGCWVKQTTYSCRALSDRHLIQIGNKLAEINASLRAQRWFK